MIGGIVLAAGRSTRMGRPKLTLPLADGRPMVVHTIEALRQADIDPIVVVAGSPPEVLQAVGPDQTVATIDGDDSMLASIQAGLRAQSGTPSTAVLILPGDMPFVRTETVRRLAEALSLGEPRIVAPSYARRRGHPVGLARAAWADVLALAPPLTLRDYLRDHSREIVYILVEDAGVLRDIDRPEDYERATGVIPRP